MKKSLCLIKGNDIFPVIKVCMDSTGNTDERAGRRIKKKLFTRSSYSILLTDEGMLLHKKAENLLAMADKITNEFHTIDDITGGDIYIG